MLDHGLDSLILDGCQFSVKGDVQIASFCAAVFDRKGDTKVGEQVLQVGDASAWETHVLRVVLGAADDARRERRRQAHRLLLVELGVLESGQAFDLVDDVRRQTCRLHEQELRENGLDATR